MYSYIYYYLCLVICLLRECTGITVYTIHLPLFFAVLGNDNKNSSEFLVFFICFASIKFASSLFCLFIVDRKYIIKF